MKMFDDAICEEIPYENKKEQIKYVIEELNKKCKNEEINDILIIARTNEKTIGKYGLPQNIFNFCSLTEEDEANVFMRFSVDIISESMKNIIGKLVFDGVLQELKECKYLTDEVIETFKNKE